MSTLNPLAAKPAGNHPPLNLHRLSLSKPIYPLSFRTIPPPSPPHFSHSGVKASSRIPNPKYPNKPTQKLQTNPETPNLMPVKSTLATAIAAAALFLSGFHFPPRSSIAAPIPPPHAAETAAVVSDTAGENAKSVNTQTQSHSSSVDVDKLKDSIETNLKAKRIPEAMQTLEKLMQLEPDEVEWRLLRANLYAQNGEFQSARNVLHEMLNENPSSLDACQGLVNVESEDESAEELNNTEKRIEEAIRLSNKNGDTKELKFLLAQIRVLEGKYDDALELYKELEKEEPGDCRVYLCQGLVYVLLKREREAEMSFDKFRRLVPQGDIFASYFGDSFSSEK